MASRIDWLTDPAQPLGHELSKRLGNQKVALSAGIVALWKLRAKDREAIVGEANGLGPAPGNLYAPLDTLETLRQFLPALIQRHHQNTQLVETLSNLLMLVEAGLSAYGLAAETSATMTVESIVTAARSRPPTPRKTSKGSMRAGE